MLFSECFWHTKRISSTKCPSAVLLASVVGCRLEWGFRKKDVPDWRIILGPASRLPAVLANILLVGFVVIFWFLEIFTNLTKQPKADLCGLVVIVFSPLWVPGLCCIISTELEQDGKAREEPRAVNYIKVSNGAKIRNRYNQVPHLTQDTNGKVTNSQKTPQTRAKRSALSQQVTKKSHFTTTAYIMIWCQQKVDVQSKIIRTYHKCADDGIEKSQKFLNTLRSDMLWWCHINITMRSLDDHERDF